jgi:hypothetical protein
MRSARITPVELLTIVAVFGILAALLLPAVGSRPPLTDEDLALELANWQPGPEHSAVPSESLRVRDADLAGAWTDRVGWTKMAIQSLDDGRYRVAFLSHARCGLSGSVQLERIAEYDEGVILLDRPVRELRGETYERLFSVRLNDSICLLPSIRVTDIQADTSEIPYRGVLAQAADPQAQAAAR